MPETVTLSGRVKDRVAFWRGVVVQPSPDQHASSAPVTVEVPDGATC